MHLLMSRAAQHLLFLLLATALAACASLPSEQATGTMPPGQTVTAPSPTVQPTPVPWEAFQSEQARFKVEFPSAARVITETSDYGFFGYTTYTTTVILPSGSAYIASATPYPPDVFYQGDIGALGMYEELWRWKIFEGRAPTSEIARFNESTLHLGPYIGRRFEISTTTGQFYEARLFLGNSVVYRLIVSDRFSPNNEAEVKQNAQRFFESFTIFGDPGPISPAWQTYSPSEVDGTIDLPSQPQEARGTAQDTEVATYTVTVPDQDIHYSLSVTKYLTQTFADDRDTAWQLIDAAEKRMIVSFGGNVEENGGGAIDYYPVADRQTDFYTPDYKRYVLARFFVADNRLYQLVSVGPLTGAEAAKTKDRQSAAYDIWRFFLSFDTPKT